MFHVNNKEVWKDAFEFSPLNPLLIYSFWVSGIYVLVIPVFGNNLTIGQKRINSG